MSNNTGGAAFPQCSYNMKGGYDITGGMTLRDWFAGQAMKYMGLPTKVSASGYIGDNIWSLQEMESFPYDDMAAVAYRWADAMLKAREESK